MNPKGRRSRPPARTRRLLGTLAAFAALMVLSGCSQGVLRLPRPAPATTVTTTSAPLSPTDPIPASPSTAPATTPSAPSKAQIRARVDTAVKALAAHQPEGSVSIAALNPATGARYSFGAKQGMWTASVYKLLVLETLLLRHQQEGATLSTGELAEATRMIENSDNVAGYQLFLDAGGNSGLANTAERLGMRHTVPGRTDPTFTTTSAQDCLAMLRALRGSGPLDATSRSLALRLMRGVEADQRWGVGVLADPGTSFANKNGWLSVDDSNGPGEDDDGRWVVNSVGIVTMHGHAVLVAVLTQHQHSFSDGVRLVQKLARTIRPVIA